MLWRRCLVSVGIGHRMNFPQKPLDPEANTGSGNSRCSLTVILQQGCPWPTRTQDGRRTRRLCHMQPTADASNPITTLSPATLGSKRNDDKISSLLAIGESFLAIFLTAGFVLHQVATVKSQIRGSKVQSWLFGNYPSFARGQGRGRREVDQQL